MLQHEDDGAGIFKLNACRSLSVDGFVQKKPQFDDLTMLCLEYKGPADKYG